MSCETLHENTTKNMSRDVISDDIDFENSIKRLSSVTMAASMAASPRKLLSLASTLTKMD